VREGCKENARAVTGSWLRLQRFRLRAFGRWIRGGKRGVVEKLEREPGRERLRQRRWKTVSTETKAKRRE